MSTFPAVDQFIRESQDWPSFFAATTQLPERARGGKPDKGKVFERLTQLLLITLPEYQTKLRHVWLARDVPPDVRAKTGLPENDEGVDLVAETHEDQYWAVQSKFITDTQKRLTVGKLSTFLNTAFNVCRNVSLAVVVDTCSKPVLKSGLLGRTTEIGLDRWLALDDEQWGRIRTATSTPAPPPVPLSPRPHQEAAVKAAATHFVERNERRGRLIMPCGTGKSLTAFWVARSLDAQSIVVAVPSLALIKQSLAGWTREYLAHGEVPDWLCVCSDETTGNIEHDEFVGKVYQLGVDAHTDPEQIADFLRLRGAPRKIVFVTYQSGEVLATAARKAGFEFDLAILDEAHRTVGDRDRTFAHLLSDENIRIKRRLFMTATERVVRGADDEVLSMDDARVYGRRFFQLTFKQAIESDPPIISDYKIVTMTISDEHVRDLVERNRSLQTSHETLGEREAQALAAGITLQRTFEEEGTRHAISFHRSIRAAQDFRDQHEKIVALRQESRKTACFHVSSHRTTGERTQILDQFTKSPKAVITNARCLQEGVDIPSVDCILFADPKQSVVDIVQAAGRALRPFPGKRFGYIVVPIVVPSGMSFDTFAETTAFKQVARVIAALSTQDDRIAEEFRVAVNLPRSGGRIVEIRGDVPLAHQIGFEEFRERVLLKIWARLGPANWRPFAVARAFVRGLGLANRDEWQTFCGGDDRPVDLPTNPPRVYQGEGWVSWGDWLGTGFVANQLRRFRPFEEARAFVHGLGLRWTADWFNYAMSRERPFDIPTAPARAYRDQGWVSMGDWLGTGSVHPSRREFRPFEEAREFARGLGLKSGTEWHALCRGGRLPMDIPTNPNKVYRGEGWRSMGDWLGTGAIASQSLRYRRFEEARAFARSLGLRSGVEWHAFCQTDMKPHDIPAKPERTYRNEGWVGMADWLGTGRVSPRLRTYRSFEEARAFVRSLGMKSEGEWLAFTRSRRLPADIPATPRQKYRGKGWVSMGDWLGTGRVASQALRFRPFGEARDFVHSLGLESGTSWRTYCRSGSLPPDIPAAPWSTYHGKGWVGMGDWLGTRRVATRRRQYRAFQEARAFARSLGLRSAAEWRAFCIGGNLPEDIPAKPERTYHHEGWAGIGDWLASGRISNRQRVFRPFEEARAFARGLRLGSFEEWVAWCAAGSRPPDIPSNPSLAYRNQGWVSMGDWLGTGNVANSLRGYRPFGAARAFARSLGYKSWAEWRAYCKSGLRPQDIPTNPWQTYRSKGWAGMKDWLGADRLTRQ